MYNQESDDLINLSRYQIPIIGRDQAAWYSRK